MAFIDNVNHPKHYTQGGIECIEAIDAAVINKPTTREAVCVANVIKYLWRYESKNGLEDVKKARWYLDRLLMHISKRERKKEKKHKRGAKKMIKSDRSVRVKNYAISVCIVKGGALADVAEHLKEALENVRILDSHYAAKLIKQIYKYYIWRAR